MESLEPQTEPDPRPTAAGTTVPQRPTDDLTLEELVSREDLEVLHRDVLSPSFPPEELESLEALVEGAGQGRLQALGVRHEGRVVAGAVAAGTGEPGDVMLLLYLAIAPGMRGGGIGGALLDGAVRAWVEQTSPGLLLAEVEHPDHHGASDAHGDPAARLRFYSRHGARALAVPYFQPGIGVSGARVPALLLTTLHVAPDVVAAGPVDAPTAVRAERLREFLAAYLAGSEGSLRDDADTRALLDAVSMPSVALVSLDDLADVPVGMAWAATGPKARLGE